MTDDKSALDLEAIERRAAQPVYPAQGADLMQAHADRGALLAALREAREEIALSGAGQAANPWLSSAGRSADDPDWDEYQAAIRRARPPRPMVRPRTRCPK